MGHGGGDAKYLSGQREAGQLLHRGRLPGVPTMEHLSTIQAGQQQEHHQHQRARRVQDDVCVSGIRRCCCPCEVLLCPQTQN